MDNESPPVDVDALVAAVVARLHRCGLPSPFPPAEAATAAPAVLGAEMAPLLAVKTEDRAGDLFGPPLGQQRPWVEDLRQQLHLSAHFGVREREEVRGLLVIGETLGLPPEHQAWYWGWVRQRLFIIIAYHHQRPHR